MRVPGRRPSPSFDRLVHDLGGEGERPVVPSCGWDCIVIDPTRVQVESICSDDDLATAGLHWFQVFFETGSGRCFITRGEALRLRQLSTDWVKRALSNLATRYGTDWLEDALTLRPGLLLHYSDADEPWERVSAEAERAGSSEERGRGVPSIAIEARGG